MRRFVLAAFALTVLAACQPATTELTEEQKAEIAAEVRDVVGEYTDAIEAADLDGWMSYWSSEPEQFFQGQPALFVNRLTILPTMENIRTAWESAFDARSAHDLVAENEYVAVVGEDAALYVFDGTFSISDTLGNTTEPAPYTVSIVWVRQSGEWKVLHRHQSWNPTD